MNTKIHSAPIITWDTGHDTVLIAYITDHGRAFPRAPFIHVMPEAITRPSEIAALKGNECAMLIFSGGYDAGR